jgi:threonine dehydrogenase-like Zn-dependent dehydrogenase
VNDDIVLRITATAICGSDLHLYRGKVPGLEDGDILGHEFMGVVEEAGPGVHKLERGDRVVVPFMIACGDCFFCERQLYAACETTNPQTGVLEGRGALIEMMSVPCARMLGAERVFLVDHHPYRLRFAERVWNVTPIDFDDVDDPAEAIVDATGGRGGGAGGGARGGGGGVRPPPHRGTTPK